MLLPVALLLGFGLGALQLGDDTARGLGLRVDRERGALVLVAVALAAVATACAGPVAFVALAPPGCARDRRQITPTTSGTDLRAMPWGRMTPQPFPGSSLARSARSEPATDPGAAAASVDMPSR